jgi:phosphoribosylanthranilate isomerase
MTLRRTSPLVKICGLRSPEAARAAVQAGADLLGFNFAPVSKRRIDPEVADGAIAAARAAGKPGIAGIFVNQPIDEVVTIAAECVLDYVQLSGHEDAAYCAEVTLRTGRLVIKAVRLTAPDEASRIETYTAGSSVRFLLADAAVAGSWGGSGAAWDWSAAAYLAARFPLLLAGGLNAENVGEAITVVRPFGVDVASGVETNGHTDPEKVHAFIQTVKHVPVAPLPIAGAARV